MKRIIIGTSEGVGLPISAPVQENQECVNCGSAIHRMIPRIRWVKKNDCFALEYFSYLNNKWTEVPFIENP